MQPHPPPGWPVPPSAPSREPVACWPKRASPVSVCRLASARSGAVEDSLVAVISALRTSLEAIQDELLEKIKAKPELDRLFHLLQSLHGGYEFMMMTPRCTVQENHIDFQLTRSAAYDTLFEAVCDDLRARCGAAGLHSILAHELIHWLRLMPYKLNKDKKRAPMFYAGLVMVANDLNTWENEGKFDEKARTDRR